jgi:DtxR family Mn-dependent transcriptional regulator
MEEKTVEEYCRVIKKLGGSGEARSADIARALGLSRNTVALTLKKLVEEGFIEKERYGTVRLADKGTLVAKKMDFRHRVLESFLFTKLKMDSRSVHREACAMEHAVSDEMIERLYQFIGRPRTDPHGRKI